MAVLNPKHLLEQAERLLEPLGTRSLVRQADRRRAISAAYYAVFHATLTAVADAFVGDAERDSARYALVYRSVDHGKLEGLCKLASSKKIDPKGKYAKFIPEEGFGESVREFASLLIELKEKRNSADYDPSHWVKIVDARNAIASAESAIDKFQKAPKEEMSIFLTLLVFSSR